MKPTESGPRGRDWWTPPALVRHLDDEFGFTIDGAADDRSALFDRWWGPEGLEEDALVTPWTGERVWCNPPFKIGRKFVEKAAQREADLAVLLVLASIDSKWWHDFVVPTVDEVRFIAGRVTFDLPEGEEMPKSGVAAIPTPMCVLVWDKANPMPSTGPRVVWSWTWPDRNRGSYAWEIR